ncbi:MAG TPA: FkbM family methyltransferase [Phnomibacter sp.]|nr:FkbM family methyltransferase [Phnomibacter sp.]
MKAKIKRLLKKWRGANIETDAKGTLSYAQCGEDLIMDFCLSQIGVIKPFYLDIGAYHPYKLNNTYYFYQRGAIGINIEPNPAAFSLFSKYRPNDQNLNEGISIDKTGIGILYTFPAATLNTFSLEEAERIEEMGTYKIIDRVETPITSVEDLIERHLQNQKIDILSIDTEGMDYDIMKCFMVNNYFPSIICAETLIYEELKKPSKRTEVIELLTQYGYEVYADTYINTIFLKA